MNGPLVLCLEVLCKLEVSSNKVRSEICPLYRGANFSVDPVNQ